MTRRHRRYALAAVALALTAATGIPAPAAGQQPSGQHAPGPRTVTLITGDRVQLHGNRPPTIVPGQGRERIVFRSYTDRGDTYVLPSDAAALVTSGRVDSRLFNVSKLLNSRYDDRSRPDLPMIVTGTANRLRGLTDTGSSVTRMLPSIGATAIRADRSGRLWRSLRGPSPATLSAGVSRVWLDAPVRATLDHSVPQIGAPAAWQDGHTGAGTKVAVLDTGVDAGHPDLAGAVVAARDFTDSESGPTDKFGHGTHVASIVTGSGSSYRGVAPDAALLNGKVLDDFGGGSDSGVIAGMEWAAAQGADVVNLSLGSSFPGDGTDPVEQAINRLTAETGALFVVAAGNNGADEAVTSPATADAAMAVGAVDRQDQLADFSTRGPRSGDGALKPDITAPGVGIVAARAADAVIGEPVGADHLRLSGTSMATPHVAGAAAILAGQHNTWDADELKASLMGSAAPNPDLTVDQQGAGRVDVARASRQQVRAGSGSLWLGNALWPHTDDKPIVRTVGYANDSAHPVTLRLSADVRDPAGKPAPAGMFTVTPATLTVPAGGSASATLTADTLLGGPDGRYLGAIVATDGSSQVRTPVGVNREVESYDVTLTLLDHDGGPAAEPFNRFVSIERPRAWFPSNSTGTVALRLPKGTYYLESGISTPDREHPGEYLSTQFYEPRVNVTGPTSLRLDAREGKKLAVRSADHPEARQRTGVVSSARDTDWGGKASTGNILIAGSFDGLFYRPSRTAAPGAYTFAVEGHLSRPDGAGGYAGSPYNYHLGWATDGTVPATLDRSYRDRDLASATAVINAQVAGEVVDKDDMAAVTAPGRTVDRYSPGMRFQYRSFVTQFKDRETYDLAWNQYGGAPNFPTKGTKPPSRWNLGPFGPGFGTEQALSTREGDELELDIPLHSDQVPSHYGYSAIDSGSTRLLRDGVELAREDWAGSLDAEVPPEPATYRVETEAMRSNSPFSTTVRGAWTFRSEQVTEERPLPLLAMRFAPRLDALNRAPAGRPFALPLYAQGQPGATYGRITTVGVEVSYDDGATWRQAPVVGTGSHRTALLVHPRGDGFVSLRAKAIDALGNKVEQTVIHAYQLKGSG